MIHEWEFRGLRQMRRMWKTRPQLKQREKPGEIYLLGVVKEHFKIWVPEVFLWSYSSLPHKHHFDEHHHTCAKALSTSRWVCMCVSECVWWSRGQVWHLGIHQMDRCRQWRSKSLELESVTKSVHDQSCDQYMVATWSLHDQLREQCVIATWSVHVQPYRVRHKRTTFFNWMNV